MKNQNPLVQQLLYLIGIFIFLLAMYVQCLDGKAVWDDHFRFFNKPEWFVKQDSPFYFWVWGFRWPLYNTILFLMFRVFEYNTVPYHVLNVFLYSVGGLLYLNLLNRFYEKKWAWLILGIFLVHPLNVQNVAWIIQIKSLLSLIFLLASIIFYLDWRQLGGKKLLIFSLISFALMLFSKSYVIHLGIFIFMYEYLKDKKFFNSLKYSAPFLIMAIIYGVYFFSGKFHRDHLRGVNYKKEKENIKEAYKNKAKEIKQENATIQDINQIDELSGFEISKNKNLINLALKLKSSAEIDFVELPPDQLVELRKIYNFYNPNSYEVNNYDMFYKKMAHMGQIFNFYLFKIFIPVNLQGMYSIFDLDKSPFIKFQIIIFICFVIFFYICIVKFFMGTLGLNSLLISMAILGYLPISGILKAPFMSITDVSDHHMIIPLLTLIPAMINWLMKLNTKENLKNIFSSGLIFIFFIQSFNYAKTFKGNESFYLNIIEKDPSQMVAYLNLGNHYRTIKKYNESRETFVKGYNAYIKHFPELTENAHIPKNILKLPINSPIFYAHPYLDPYFLMIIRNIVSFKRAESGDEQNNSAENKEDL